MRDIVYGSLCAGEPTSVIDLAAEGRDPRQHSVIMTSSCDDDNGQRFLSDVKVLLNKDDAAKHVPKLTSALQKSYLIGCKSAIYRIIFEKLMSEDPMTSLQIELITLIRTLYQKGGLPGADHPHAIETVSEEHGIPHKLFKTTAQYPSELVKNIYTTDTVPERTVSDLSEVEWYEILFNLEHITSKKSKFVVHLMLQLKRGVKYNWKYNWIETIPQKIQETINDYVLPQEQVDAILSDASEDANVKEWLADYVVNADRVTADNALAVAQHGDISTRCKAFGDALDALLKKTFMSEEDLGRLEKAARRNSCVVSHVMKRVSELPHAGLINVLRRLTVGKKNEVNDMADEFDVPRGLFAITATYPGKFVLGVLNGTTTVTNWHEVGLVDWCEVIMNVDNVIKTVSSVNDIELIRQLAEVMEHPTHDVLGKVPERVKNAINAYLASPKVTNFIRENLRLR